MGKITRARKLQKTTMPSVSDNQEIYVGNIVTGDNRKNPLVKENTALVVKDGTIVAKGCARNILDRYEGEVIALGENEFLAPGFVDAHLHAPQFKNAGMHLDKPLLDWLQNYTFPLEDRFKNVEDAERTYPHGSKATLSKGSTTAAYFGSIHKDACLVLADEAEVQGQRAFVGKTNMDTNTLADYYRDESSQQSLNDTLDFVHRMSEMKFRLKSRLPKICSLIAKTILVSMKTLVYLARALFWPTQYLLLMTNTNAWLPLVLPLFIVPIQISS